MPNFSLSRVPSLLIFEDKSGARIAELIIRLATIANLIAFGNFCDIFSSLY